MKIFIEDMNIQEIAHNITNRIDRIIMLASEAKLNMGDIKKQRRKLILAQNILNRLIDDLRDEDAYYSINSFDEETVNNLWFKYGYDNIYTEKEVVQQYDDVCIYLTQEFIRDLVNGCKTVEDIKAVLAILLSSKPVYTSEELDSALMEKAKKLKKHCHRLH